ncbi:MAG: DUF58 domain-containing protein [Acidobacteria bacterium]|nr:DUF58 domain-containing protein [Acidobacteriota bacterium]
MLNKLIRIFAEVDREAWVRFSIALLGLIFSFAFALLSSSLRDEGNLLGTAITASLALLTAGIVGVTTVPYLARQVSFERFRFSVRYDFTREGIAYTLFALVVGIAALNTGNNLLFIVVAAMLAAVLVSGIASSFVLSGLTLKLALPDHVFAGKPCIGNVTIRNTGRLPSFSISVVPEKVKQRKRWKLQRTELGIPPFRGFRQWFRVPDLQLRSLPATASDPPILDRPAYFPYLRPRHSESAAVELRFPRRGRYVQQALGVATRFPFSFITKTRIVPFSQELIVLPAVEETDEFLTILPTLRGEFEIFVAGRGYDLYRIREYAAGDAARHIDWKASARSQALMVREFTREDERKLKIVFDNPAPGQLSEEEYERAVRLAASLAWHFSDGRTEVSFAGPGYAGAPEALTFLRYLALVKPEVKGLVLEDIPAPNAYNIVVTARPRGSIPTPVWVSSYVIFVGP